MAEKETRKPAASRKPGKSGEEKRSAGAAGAAGAAKGGKSGGEKRAGAAKTGAPRAGGAGGSKSAAAAGGREKRVRDRAYEIWEQEGRPAGKEREHWERADREVPR